MQSAGAALPVLHELPVGQPVHSEAADRLVELEYEPAGHGSGADAPSGQYDPASHATQPVEPVSFWNVPPEQASQVAYPVVGAKLPALHGVGAKLPVLHEWPDQHAVHSTAAPRSVAAE